jgi:hypothetical protein
MEQGRRAVVPAAPYYWFEWAVNGGLLLLPLVVLVAVTTGAIWKVSLATLILFALWRLMHAATFVRVSDQGVSEWFAGRRVSTTDWADIQGVEIRRTVFHARSGYPGQSSSSPIDVVHLVRRDGEAVPLWSMQYPIVPGRDADSAARCCERLDDLRAGHAAAQ